MGEQLAKMELFLMFSNLMQAFTFRLPDGLATALHGRAIWTYTGTLPLHCPCDSSSLRPCDCC
ncbi:hypothetical protein ANANG_G00317350 [Anguilla anguilla]|uniref:Uncharacterized protein n=1 Tax=Anguilla anguilla TaxID=7936 RepID=A0A9D3LHS0_ANGAN|nr:hypothetical protein ANANG_G00317350 [Anguilla anguilla]